MSGWEISRFCLGDATKGRCLFGDTKQQVAQFAVLVVLKGICCCTCWVGETLANSRWLDKKESEGREYPALEPQKGLVLTKVSVVIEA